MSTWRILGIILIVVYILLNILKIIPQASATWFNLILDAIIIVLLLKDQKAKKKAK